MNLKLFERRFKNFTAPYAKLVDCTTLVESKFSISEDNSHLWIDILPVDGLPSDFDSVVSIYRKAGRYRSMLVLSEARLGEGKTLVRKLFKYIGKPVANLIGKEYFARQIEKLAMTVPFENAEYVGIITWGLYGPGERMLKSEFQRLIEVEFEGYKFPAFFVLG